jgi:hypothetical protein
MRIRFLQTTPSASPDHPFLPGQVIEVTKLTAEMRSWLKASGDSSPRAELLKDEPERAVVQVRERAVTQ